MRGLQWKTEKTAVTLHRPQHGTLRLTWGSQKTASRGSINGTMLQFAIGFTSAPLPYMLENGFPEGDRHE
jgi:hypothetical protein